MSQDRNIESRPFALQSRSMVRMLSGLPFRGAAMGRNHRSSQSLGQSNTTRPAPVYWQTESTESPASFGTYNTRFLQSVPNLPGASGIRTSRSRLWRTLALR